MLLSTDVNNWFIQSAALQSCTGTLSTQRSQPTIYEIMSLKVSFFIFLLKNILIPHWLFIWPDPCQLITKAYYIGMSTKYFCVYLEIETFLTQDQAKLNFSTQQGKGKALKTGLESIRNKKMENP